MVPQWFEQPYFSLPNNYDYLLFRQFSEGHGFPKGIHWWFNEQVLSTLPAHKVFKLTALSVRRAFYPIQPRPSIAWRSVWPGRSPGQHHMPDRGGGRGGCLNKSKSTTTTYMNTNARGRLLARFLAKIIINKLIFSASPLCEDWHGFLQNQGNLDQ